MTYRLAIKSEARNPNHAPAGSPTGGQFVSGGGGGSSSNAGTRPNEINNSAPTTSTAARTPSGILVPKAWTNLRLATSPDAPLQCVGTDSKGRRQYLYSAKHVTEAAVAKFERLKAFNEALPTIDQAMARDKAKSEEAAALSMISKTGFRIGSDKDTKAKVKAYGVSTMVGRQVSINGDTVHFDFIAKKGVHMQKDVKDAELAADLAPRIKNPDGKVFQTSDRSIRKYLKGVSKQFTPKDFRTWVGTSTALKEVQAMEPPKNAREFKAKQHEVAVKVGQVLGDTPDVALGSYVDPTVFSKWLDAVPTMKSEDRIDLTTFLNSIHFDETIDWTKYPEDDSEEAEELPDAVKALSDSVLGLKMASTKSVEADNSIPQIFALRAK
jgi:DNA topoisomerase I